MAGIECTTQDLAWGLFTEGINWEVAEQQV
jgi:hypothetical protein